MKITIHQKETGWEIRTQRIPGGILDPHSIISYAYQVETVENMLQVVKMLAEGWEDCGDQYYQNKITDIKKAFAKVEEMK